MKRSNTAFSQSICSKPELQLFPSPGEPESCVKDSHVLVVYPTASLDNEGQMEFVIHPSDLYYLDFYNSCLKLSVKITKESGEDVHSFTDSMKKVAKGSDSADKQNIDANKSSKNPQITDEIKAKNSAAPSKRDYNNCPIPVNNFAHSLFSQCTMEIQGTHVGAPANNLYPFIAYIQNTLSMSKATKEAILQVPALYMDDSLRSKEVAVNKDKPNRVSMLDNRLLKEAAELIANSKVVHMYMKPFIDFFYQTKFIPNNTEIRLKMTRSTAEFALMRFEGYGNERYKIKFVGATLELRRVTLAEHTDKAFQSHFARGMKATYWFPTIDAKHFEIGKIKFY